MSRKRPSGVIPLFSLVLLATLAPPASVLADDTGAISGAVVTSQGAPVAKARVTVADLRRRAETDAAGLFRLEDLPPGKYLVEVVSPRFGSAVMEAPVVAGQTTELRIQLDLTVHHEDIIVSASPYAREASSLGRPVTILDGADLQEDVQPTLGETLAREPGVSSTSYSPGASRPVIRGQGGDRIRILEAGIGTADASNVSEDHAVAVDPGSAEKIEIIRGPSTLLYGSNAVGGIVNVLDGRIPDHVGDKPIGGAFEARYGSNADEGAGMVTLEGGVRQFAWRLDGSKRDGGDSTTPEGTLDNSDLNTERGSAGVSWAGDRGYIGLSRERFETEYGIPNPAEPVRIVMDRDRWDLEGAYTAPLGFLRGVKVRFGTGDYEHNEVDDAGVVGNTFFNDSWEGRLEFTHRQAGAFRGSFGLQAADRDFESVGEEAFVPPTLTRSQALFAVEEIAAGPVTFEVGARYEDQDNEVSDPLLPARSFDGLSASGGIVWRIPADCTLAFTVARSVRLPSAEELYANGPHLATFQFQVGDPDLDRETGLGYDLSFRRTAGRVSGEVSLFSHDFSDYIFLSPTGAFVDVDGELVPEYLYIQTDADFHGAEAHLDIAMLHHDPHHLDLELSADLVRAEETGGEPLPFITPTRYGVGVRYRGPHLWGFVEARRTAEQDRTPSFETPTAGYTWFNASVGWRFFAAATVHDLILRGLNLSDELSRNHLSPLKDVVPMPGRDLTLSYRLTF